MRIHGETQQRPIDLLLQERPHLGSLNPHPYDIARTFTSVASSQFRITVDTNHYSVPVSYAHRRLTVKAYPDRICIYFDNQLIARHARQYGRHQDIEDPDHVKALLAQRRRAREQRLMLSFLGLAFEAFSAEYIANLLEARTRALPEPGPLQLTRRHDLLDIDIDPPDLNDYKVNDHDTE